MGRCSISDTSASPRRRSHSNPSALGLPTAPICAVVAPRRPRRGEDIWSRIFFRIAPARVGTVAVIRIVPSPLSCRVHRVLARAASSSSRSWASSAASTLRRSRSMTSSARRAGGVERLGVHPPGLGHQGGLDRSDRRSAGPAASWTPSITEGAPMRAARGQRIGRPAPAHEEDPQQEARTPTKPMASGSSPAVTTLDQPSQRGSTPWRCAATATPAVSRIAARAPRRRVGSRRSRTAGGCSARAQSPDPCRVRRRAGDRVPGQDQHRRGQAPRKATRAADVAAGPARSRPPAHS